MKHVLQTLSLSTLPWFLTSKQLRTSYSFIMCVKTPSETGSYWEAIEVVVAARYLYDMHLLLLMEEIRLTSWKQQFIPLFTGFYIHPRWWSPDFWTINRKITLGKRFPIVCSPFNVFEARHRNSSCHDPLGSPASPARLVRSAQS